MGFAFPELSDRMVYDRQEILNGEWWRLFTAPFTHFSGQQLAWNLALFAAAGTVVETSRYRHFGWVCFFAIVSPGPFLLLTEPGLSRYGGLSGPATAAAAYLCIQRARASAARRPRVTWGLLLSLIAIKILVEALGGVAVFVRAENASFRVLPAAHALGFIGALAVAAMTRPVLAQDP